VETVLRWLALGVGALAAGNALLRSGFQHRLPRSARPFLGVAAGVIVLVALLTLPVAPPFSAGQTLGPGILLGGIAALLGMLVLPTIGADGSRSTSYLAWSVRLGAPVVGVALLLIFYPSRIFDALSGFTLGAVGVALIAGGGLTLATRVESDDDMARHQLAAGAELTAMFATCLAVATYLATYHQSPTGVREWQALPALLGATAALLVAIRSLVTAPAGRDCLFDLLVIPIPLLVVGWLAAHQLHGSPELFRVLAIGLGVFGVVAWLERASVDREIEPRRSRPDLGLITALAVLGGAVVAFRELSGYGLAVLALAGTSLLPVALAGGRDTAAGRLSINATHVAILLVIYRVFTERNDYSRGFQPDFLYYYVALVLGALLPALLAGLAEETMSAGAAGADAPSARSAFSALARVLLVGAVSLASPLALWLLVGDRPAAAMLVGLTVGAVMLAARDGASGSVRAPIWRLSSTLIAVSAVQFTHLLLPLALRTRSQRLGVLAAVAVVVLLAIAATAWRESRWRARPVSR